MEKSEIRKSPFFRRLLTGFFIGLAAIAPGISGGAITVIFGLYESITDAIGHLFEDFREKVKFLLPLGIGGGLGILLFGKIINYFFLHYNDLTCALFVGLIAGTLPGVFRAASKEGFRLRYLLATAGCGALVIWLTTLEQLQYTGITAELPGWLALLCGGVVGFGSVLPGVSASFVLMAIGVYEPMLRALDSLDVPRLLLIGGGFCAVVLLMSRFVSFLFRKAHGWMSFAVAGLLLGSIVTVVPIPTLDGHGALMAALALAGAAGSYFLLKLQK